MRFNTNVDVTAAWKDDAACHAKATEDEKFSGAWINEQGVRRHVAENICRTQCEVRNQCLADALTDPWAEGLRGGYWFSTGALLSRDRTKMVREFPQHKKAARTRHNSSITNNGMAS